MYLKSRRPRFLLIYSSNDWARKLEIPLSLLPGWQGANSLNHRFLSFRAHNSKQQSQDSDSGILIRNARHFKWHLQPLCIKFLPPNLSFFQVFTKPESIYFLHIMKAQPSKYVYKLPETTKTLLSKLTMFSQIENTAPTNWITFWIDFPRGTLLQQN